MTRGRSITQVMGLIAPALTTIAAIAVCVGVRLHGPSPRWPWVLMGAALACCGITGWSGIPALMPLYILGELALVGAFAGLVRRQGGVARAAAIDASIITLAFAAVTWLYLVGPYASAASASGLPRASAPVVGVIDVVLVATGSLLMLGGRREGRSTLLLTGAIAGLVASHLMFLWSALHGGHGVAGPDTVAWGAFCVLLAGAALHPSMRLLSVPAERSGTGLTRARLAVFAVASLVAPSVTIAQAVLHRPSHVVISIASGVIFLLVLLRIADLVREHEALTESNLRDRFEARLGSLVRNSSDVVSIVDADGVVLYISPAALRLVGLDEAGAEGMDWWEFVHPDDQPGLQWFLADLEQGASGDVEYRVRDARGSWIDVETLATNLIGDGAVEGIVLNTRDVSDRKALERRLLHQASHDTLTGLPNRMLLRDRVEQALARRRRSGDAARGAVPRPRRLQERQRHARPRRRATQLLRRSRERLRGCVRAGDTVGAAGRRRVRGAARRRRPTEPGDRRSPSGSSRRCAEPFDVDGPRRSSRRRSIGIASRVDGRDTADALLRDADVAMYPAKDRGQGRATRSSSRPCSAAAVDALQLKATSRARSPRGEIELVLPADRRPARPATIRRGGARCAGSTPSAGLLARPSSSRSPRRPA